MTIVSYESSYQNIYGCDQFVSEKADLYRQDRQGGSQYSNWLDRQLRFLDTDGIDYVLNNHPNVFEKLSGVPEGIYSIRYRGFRGNPRVLFFSVEDEEEGDQFYVLLTAFKETSSGAYDRAIRTAKKRRKTILEELDQEGGQNEQEITDQPTGPAAGAFS